MPRREQPPVDPEQPTTRRAMMLATVAQIYPFNDWIENGDFGRNPTEFVPRLGLHLTRHVTDGLSTAMALERMIDCTNEVRRYLDDLSGHLNAMQLQARSHELRAERLRMRERQRLRRQIASWRPQIDREIISESPSAGAVFYTYENAVDVVYPIDASTYVAYAFDTRRGFDRWWNGLAAGRSAVQRAYWAWQDAQGEINQPLVEQPLLYDGRVWFVLHDQGMTIQPQRRALVRYDAATGTATVLRVNEPDGTEVAPMVAPRTTTRSGARRQPVVATPDEWLDARERV